MGNMKAGYDLVRQLTGDMVYGNVFLILLWE